MSKPAADSKPLTKSLCDWSKHDFKEHFEQLQAIVACPKYACIKCGRAANSKKWLCKAKKLEG